MTADEIRNYPLTLHGYSLGELPLGIPMADCAEMLREIAAQLAELNANLNRLSVDDIGALLVNGQVHGR